MLPAVDDYTAVYTIDFTSASTYGIFDATRRRFFFLLIYYIYFRRSIFDTYSELFARSTAAIFITRGLLLEWRHAKVMTMTSYSRCPQAWRFGICIMSFRKENCSVHYTGWTKSWSSLVNRLSACYSRHQLWWGELTTNPSHLFIFCYFSNIKIWPALRWCP